MRRVAGSLNMSSQEVKAFTRTGFDQSGNQQAIDGTLRLEFSHEFVQSPTVAAGFQPSKGDPTFLQQVQHPLEVLQFLVDDADHLAAQRLVVDVGKDQVHGRSGRFFFAVGMVDQDLVQTRNSGVPASAGRSLIAGSA